MTRILKRGWNIPIERNKTDKKILNYLEYVFLVKKFI